MPRLKVTVWAVRRKLGREEKVYTRLTWETEISLKFLEADNEAGKPTWTQDFFCKMFGRW